MTLHDYFLEQPRGAKTQMALALGITKTWLSQVLSGHHRPSPYLAKAIQKYTKGAVTSKEDRKSTRLNSSHMSESRMPSSA